MTRQDYVRIARAVARVNRNLPGMSPSFEELVMDQVIDSLVIELTDDNPRFDESRFREACTA